MTTRTPTPIRSDDQGRLNQALLDHGGQAVTTSQIGGVDLPMLVVAMGRLTCTPTACVQLGNGLFRAGFTHHGAVAGAQPVATEVTAPSRESAIVGAAIATLLTF